MIVSRELTHDPSVPSTELKTYNNNVFTTSDDLLAGSDKHAAATPPSEWSSHRKGSGFNSMGPEVGIGKRPRPLTDSA